MAADLFGAGLAAPREEPGTFVGLPPGQASFEAWWQEWFKETWFSPTTARGAANYAAFANANRHIPSDADRPAHLQLWRLLRQSGHLPEGIPVHCPFAPAKEGHWYCQARIGGVKRYVHRLAAVAFSENGRQLIGQDPSLEVGGGQLYQTVDGNGCN